MNADSRFAWIAGALLAALGVTFGAFGAHGLREMLTPQALGWWETAVQYQMWHAIGLVAIGAAGLRGSRLPVLLIALGTLIFSGSLYAMALGAPRWFGAITPLGGLGMIAGWVLLAWAALRARATES